MTSIEKVDKNFKVETNIQKDDIKFYNPLEKPFKIYGVFKENGCFRRMPESVAKSVSDGVFYHHINTAGGRIKFKTDSKYVAVNVKLSQKSKMPHIPFTGSIGLDMYDGVKYVKTFVPPITVEDSFEGVIDFEDEKMHDVTINLPTYSGVSEIYIGLSEGAKILESEPYKNKKPIVYYGSSITQGGCASRPGNSYQAILERRFNLDYINLGFSGSAKAEDEMIDYIKNLDMEFFVYDYDHNAPTVEYLENTHKKMFDKIREKNPTLPIIMMTRPQYEKSEYAQKMSVVIQKTYDEAIKNGDKNVYFLDGTALMKIAKYDGTVDGCHPNDLGFFSMACALGDVIEKILNK